MSRSNPTANNPHPCTRWMEFGGADGAITYWDRESKQSIEVPKPFSFIWLDETATIKGWHDASQSGIMSNEVRDTRSDVFVVKAFKGGELCHGLYAQIRDRVGNMGGNFYTSMYLGYRDQSQSLKLGCLQLKGAALNAWIEFKKSDLAAIGKGAVTLAGTKDGQKGSIKFKTPAFTAIKDIKPETNEEAIALDRVLQTYLLGYFSRRKTEQASAPAAPVAAADEAGASEPPISEPEPQPDAPPDNEPW